MSNKLEEEIFSVIQKYLKNPPVIIWGSGATVPYGLPTMGDLNRALQEKINGFNPENENLEIELGKTKYEENLPKIKKIIWDTVNNAEKNIAQKLMCSETNDFSAIVNMTKKFYETHPQVVNIITTNYDRVLEFIMAYHGFPFSDGFTGREFSLFDDNLFKEKNIVNIIKVHGSLSWFRVESNIRHLISNIKDAEPVIICPGKNKYQESYNDPYRYLIQKADNLISKADSFFIIGFGFNDEHLTPRIKEKVNNGTPLVLITRTVSENCKIQLKYAQKHIFLEKEKEKKGTLITLKNGGNDTVKLEIINDSYWKLNKFMGIL